MRWRYRQVVLALCTAAFFVTMVGRLAISTVVPNIAAEFEVSNSLIGLALTGMWVAYALVQFPSGILADKFGERRVILASIGGTGVTVLVILGAPHFAVFVLGALLLGAATGLHFTVATALLTRTYDDIGRAIGIHTAGGPAAGLVTPIAVSWVAITYGWQLAVGLTALLAVPVYVLFARGVRPTAPREPDLPMRNQFALGPIQRLLSRREILFTAVIAIVADFTWQAISSFLPMFFVQYHDYSQPLAGTLFAVYFAAQGGLQVGVGVLADRLGRDATIGLCMVAGATGLGVLVTGSGLPTLVGGVVLLALGMGWGAAVFPRFMDQLADDQRNAGFGLIRTVYMVVAAAGSIVTGVLADVFGWAASFGFLLVLLVAVAALLGANRAFGLDY